MGQLIALVVLVVALLGLLTVVPLSSVVVFGCLLALAVAYLVGGVVLDVPWRR